MRSGGGKGIDVFCAGERCGCDGWMTVGNLGIWGLTSLGKGGGKKLHSA